MKKKYKNIVTSKPPTGAKNKECVKFLWYSTESNGSTADLIKISESGNNPPTAPKKLANLTNVKVNGVSIREQQKLKDHGVNLKKLAENLIQFFFETSC